MDELKNMCEVHIVDGASTQTWVGWTPTDMYERDLNAAIYLRNLSFHREDRLRRYWGSPWFFYPYMIFATILLLMP